MAPRDLGRRRGARYPSGMDEPRLPWAACVALTLGAAIYGLAVPILELDTTHLLNPAWPSHARLHEAWQLATNSTLAAVAVASVWWTRRAGRAVAIAAIVTGGFFVAFLTRDAYGGSMLHTDGTERRVLGVNVGVLGFVLVNVLSAVAVGLARRAAPKP